MSRTVLQRRARLRLVASSKAEIAINPRYAIAHRNLALVLHALGRDGEAVIENHEAAALSRVSGP